MVSAPCWRLPLAWPVAMSRGDVIVCDRFQASVLFCWPARKDSPLNLPCLVPSMVTSIVLGTEATALVAVAAARVALPVVAAAQVSVVADQNHVSVGEIQPVVESTDHLVVRAVVGDDRVDGIRGGLPDPGGASSGHEAGGAEKGEGEGTHGDSDESDGEGLNPATR